MQTSITRRAAALACLLAVNGASALTVDGGVDNSIAVSQYGEVHGWGGNVGGKLGNNSTINSTSPVMVFTPRLQAISTGAGHSCHVTSSGYLECWGTNGYGQLGDGTTDERHKPSWGKWGYREVAAGGLHTCGITDSGDVHCWGYGVAMGDGRETFGDQVLFQSDVLLGTNAIAISAGKWHSCALTSAGGVKCWGWNGDGQLGDNSTEWRSTPVPVVGLSSGVVAIAAGSYHTCALTSAGAVKCWGYNGHGALGNNTTPKSSVPMEVSTLSSGVASIAAGDLHSCAVTMAGAARCWGSNGSGQLGNGSTDSTPVPTGVTGLSTGVRALAAGGFHTCALIGGGGLKCWGDGLDGELGTGSFGVSSTTPVNVSGVSDALAISAGYEHTCAITASGSPKCWGYNGWGQLGDDSIASRAAPTLAWGGYGLNYLNNVVAVSAGMSHTLALTENGSVYAWGLHNHGQLGVGAGGTVDTCYTPFEGTVACAPYAVRVPGLTDVKAIGAGWRHSIALRNDGTVWTWGNNDYGQLGVGDFTGRSSPVQVRNSSGTGFLTNIHEIAGGYFHNVARHLFGQLSAWGRGGEGQLGNGLLSDSALPKSVSVFGNIVAISAKGSHTLALDDGNALWAWGLNHYGEVGNGNPADAEVETPVQVLANVVEASAGMSTSMARLADGTVWSWGLNTRGQLGRSSADTCNGWACAKQPLQLTAYTGAVRVVAAGGHGMVVRPDNVLISFGDNTSGQLGNRSGSFGGQFSQAAFDPAGRMFPAIVQGEGTALGLDLPGAGLALDTLGTGLAFGSQRVVTGTTQVAGTLVNLNPTAINIFQIAMLGEYHGFTVSHNCPARLEANFSCPINISFTPPSVGQQNGFLRLYTDAVDSNLLDFRLVGTGVEPPSAPTGVAATAGNGQATVTFNPSSSDGGSPIAYYTATSSPGGVSASAESPPITVPNLVNGTPYTFTVRATNVYGLTSDPSTPSNSVTPHVPPPALLSVKSRKSHALLGPYDVAVDATQPPAGPVSSEPRAIGTGHRIVFAFNGAISSTGTVTTSAGSVTGVMLSPSQLEVEVTLTGVPDNARASVTLPNLNGSGSGVGATIAFLIGDVNGSRSVDTSDVDLVKERSGQPVDGTNFKYDVNRSGAITAADILAAKGRLGMSVP